MDLSIIIVTWQNGKQIGRCLRSVKACAEGLKTEVILVDNASTDGTRAEAEKALAGIAGENLAVKGIWNAENRGFAAANNQGIAIAKGKHVLLLNPDTELVPGALADSVAHMAAHEDVGVLGCKLINFDGSLQPSVRRFPTWQDQSVILLKLHNFFPSLIAHYMAADFDYGKEQEADQVRGAFFMISRGLLDTIGPLDERNFFIWFEEVDYCRRAKNSGFKVMYLPSAICRHEGGASFNQHLSIRKQRWMNASLRRYFRKHGTFTDRIMILLLSPVSLLLAWAVGVAKIKPRRYV
jgi:GT2 family glycosyltransferase